MIIPVIAASTFLEIQSDNLVALLYNCFISVALIEEGIKLLLLLLLFYNRPYFNEAFDGIIYTVMLGMGFATAENLLFVGENSPVFYLQRAFTTETAHGAFSIILGYFIGQAKFSSCKKSALSSLVFGLVISTLLHGTYDLFLAISGVNQAMLYALIILIGSILIAYRFILIQVEKPPV